MSWILLQFGIGYIHIQVDLLQQAAPQRHQACGFSGAQTQDLQCVRQMCKQATLWNQQNSHQTNFIFLMYVVTLNTSKKQIWVTNLQSHFFDKIKGKPVCKVGNPEDFVFVLQVSHISIPNWFVGWFKQHSSSSLRPSLWPLVCKCVDSSSGVHTKQTKWILLHSSTNKWSCNWLLKRQFSLFTCPSVIKPPVSIVAGFSSEMSH